MVRACRVRGLQNALWIAGVAGSLLVANSGKAASGQHSAFTLSLNAPAQCPSEADVREDIDRLVGERNNDAPNLTAWLRIEAEPGGVWRLLLETELDGTPGEREVEGNSCDAVARAAAVTLALMLNPHADGEPEKSTPPPTTHFGAAAFIDATHGFAPGWSPELVVGMFGGLGRG